MAVSFHPLSVSQVEQLTDKAVALHFDVPDDLRETFSFVPGQYLTLRATIDGEDLRRSYSICSTGSRGLRVGIKAIEDGRFSGFAQTLKEGAVLHVMPPQGRFTCKPEQVAGGKFLLIAAGSGITPVLSIAASLLEETTDCEVTLVFGNQTTNSIMFRQEIEDLKDRFLARFHVYHVLSREAQDVPLFSGRIDLSRIREMADKGIISPLDADGIYICGPAEMSLALSDYFASSGVSKNAIHTELFETAQDKNRPAPTRKAVELAQSGVNVEVVLDGSARHFVLSDAGHTVLKAAEASGLELPFSCAGGMCATCRCKVVEGHGEMDNNFSLDDWEVKAGYVLACQLRPWYSPHMPVSD
ncbi:MAG: 2Fe-2S iron-sulfur cluster-binding protein, partial [Pseudomonadota bacterium]